MEISELKKQCAFLLLWLLSQNLFSQNQSLEPPQQKDIQKAVFVKTDSLTVHKKVFDISRIEEYKNSDDFSYTIQKVESSFFSRFLNWIKRTTRKILNYFFDDIEPFTGVLYSFFRILPYLILSITFFLMLKYFLNARTKRILHRTVNSMTIFGNDEELIERKDLYNLIEDAIQTKEYRIAIRFYYLLLLKKLIELEMIVFKKEKTNEDYIKELEKSIHQSKFIESTRLYDHIWYGNFEINKSDFTNAELLFKSILSM